ncbi:hypothetical protein TPHA_0A00210 [Tetrapisispora phaffii CBS 4417]|uniref:Signal peptidase complex subunit 1 n=1 Tax=Tetrapisispora phaffii (strain ATCC 24235 / CBS 4417 / NBRC 1672 / NRRL Y-8282 / UCD 70-5) TaxID=1071381 RepID=G8BMH8_TETPH|nr:hypothetical protein TPHA_0A00210 [Tetrapisispora phaffii CBS 4417]CCE61106.1 hypothetical protein TPHA_0A00210 [Tetrapisispora phaffii CBS 4417]
MSEILQDIGKKLVFPIDFKAQSSLTTKLNNILLVGSIFAMIYGYSTQSLSNAFYSYIAFISIAAMAVVPSYPSYNKHKLEWVKPKIAL